MKSCENCKYSYDAIDFKGRKMGLYCNNADYNDSEYDYKKDWGKGYCDYYEIKEEVVK